MLKIIKNALSITLALSGVNASAEPLQNYEIYPRPQKIEYKQASFSLSNTVNIVFEKGLDFYTKQRLEKILTSHAISYSYSNEIVTDKTNLLIGINESGRFVDKFFNEKVSHREEFFDKNDSHIVAVRRNIVVVLGSNTDSAFHGITTLKHVFNQLQNKHIREFRIDDIPMLSTVVLSRVITAILGAMKIAPSLCVTAVIIS